jgi:hypothetical protein
LRMMFNRLNIFIFFFFWICFFWFVLLICWHDFQSLDL